MENKKHLQLPNELIKIETIAPKDLLVYLALKRFENWETHKAYPSLKTVAQLCGCDSKTISASIERLKNSGFIHCTKKGRGKEYEFLKYTDFEPFSLEFLDNPNLTFTEKAYLAASQQFMIKEGGVGITSYNSYEMSSKINMSPSTIQRCDKSLEAKDYLSIVNTKSKDKETGVFKKEKIFNLEKFGQAVVFVLQNHEERIADNTDRIANLEKTNQILIEEINRLKREKGEDELKFTM